MSRYLLCRAGDLELAVVDGPVLDGESLPALGDAVTLLRRLQTLHEAGVRSAVASRERAREEGLVQARTIAEAQAAEAVARIAATFDDALRAERLQRRRQEVDLAVAIVARIAGDLGPATTVAALARSAIAELDVERPLRVRVAAGLEPAIRAALLGGAAGASDVTDGAGAGPHLPTTAAIEVIADERLGPFECEIDRGDGLVDAGLGVQLQAIRDALAAVGGAWS
jgi:flagellar biosynthesis/type III secretory pathway protein FliH